MERSSCKYDDISSSGKTLAFSVALPCGPAFAVLGIVQGVRRRGRSPVWRRHAHRTGTSPVIPHDLAR